MLKGIAAGFTPDLLWTIAAMGHGDMLAIVDANYPAHGVHQRVLPLAGMDTVQAGAMISALMPVDDFVAPAALWMCPDGQADAVFDVHQLFRDAVRRQEGREVAFAGLERSAFYERARGAFAVVATTDPRAYACFLLVKGVVRAAD